MKNMWEDFNDYTLVMLALRYGIAHQLDFNAQGLHNRDHVERELTKVELDMAFGDK